MKIALLGLGRMGQAIGLRLVGGGHDMTVWNRTREKAEPLVQIGARAATSPEEAIDTVDVVVTSLSDDNAVRELVLRGDRTRDALGAKVYVDMSTISTALSGELARTFPRFVALPVLGAPAAVLAGKATCLAGGPSELIDELAPMLDALGGRRVRYQRSEMASSAKLAVNLLLLSGIVALAESFAAGRSGGLSEDDLRELLGDSPMVAPGVGNRFETVLSGSGPTWWTTVLGAKDARLANEAAGSSGRPLQLAPLLGDLYRQAAEAGYEDDDIAAITHLYRR